MTKILKVVVVCIAISVIGLSLRTLVSSGSFSCAAEDVAPEEAGEAPAALPETKAAQEAAAGAAEEEGAYDFSDSSSWNLTISAWERLAEKDYDGVYAFALKCIELYEPAAKEMAAGMRRFASPGHEDDFALVNDVAAAHYVMGEAYMKEKKYDDAEREFQYIIVEYPYAQCWDPKGWFWKVAEISKKNIEKIRKEAGNDVK